MSGDSLIETPDLIVKLEKRLKEHGTAITSIEYDPESYPYARFYSASENEKITSWDERGDQPILRHKIADKKYPRTVKFVGSRVLFIGVVAFGLSKKICFRKGNMMKEGYEPKLDRVQTSTLVWTDHFGAFFFVARGNVLTITNLDNMTEGRCPFNPGELVSAVSCTRAPKEPEKHVYVAGTDKGLLVKAHLYTHQIEAKVNLPLPDAVILDLKWDPKGKWLAVGTNYGMPIIVDDQLKPTYLFEADKKQENLVTVDWSPDGRWAVFGSADGLLWFMKNDFKTTYSYRLKDEIREIRWSPKAKIIIVGTGSGDILRLNVDYPGIPQL